MKISALLHHHRRCRCVNIVDISCKSCNAQNADFVVIAAIGDRAFPVAAAHTCNSLPQHVMSTPSVCFPRSPQDFPLQACLPMTFTTTFILPTQ